MTINKIMGVRELEHDSLDFLTTEELIKENILAEGYLEEEHSEVFYKCVRQYIIDISEVLLQREGV